MRVTRKWISGEVAAQVGRRVARPLDQVEGPEALAQVLKGWVILSPLLWRADVLGGGGKQYVISYPPGLVSLQGVWREYGKKVSPHNRCFLPKPSGLNLCSHIFLENTGRAKLTDEASRAVRRAGRRAMPTIFTTPRGVVWPAVCPLAAYAGVVLRLGYEEAATWLGEIFGFWDSSLMNGAQFTWAKGETSTYA